MRRNAMAFEIVRSEEEISAVLNEALQVEIEGSRWPSEPYERGISSFADWLFGNSDTSPMED